MPFYQALQSQAFNSFDIIHSLYLYSNIYSTVDSFIAVSEGVYVHNISCTGPSQCYGSLYTNAEV